MAFLPLSSPSQVNSGAGQYNFQFNEDGGGALARQIARADSVTGGAGGTVSIQSAPAKASSPTTAPSAVVAACVDKATGDGYTCVQQQAWGKCGEAWMSSGGFCAKSCGRCGARRADGGEEVVDGGGRRLAQAAPTDPAADGGRPPPPHRHHPGAPPEPAPRVSARSARAAAAADAAAAAARISVPERQPAIDD
jgi:hypothetical protein